MNHDNVMDMLKQENKLIFQLLLENKKILQDDLKKDVSPLWQYRWELISRKLEVEGLKYSWLELRDKFRYWVDNGLFNLDTLEIVYNSEGKENLSDGDDSVDNCSQLLQNLSNSDLYNLPCTSTPKSSKHTTNILCNLTISPMSNANQKKMLKLDNENKLALTANKEIQTTLPDVMEEKIYYVDSNTCELKPCEEIQVMALETVDQKALETRKRKLEMSIFEKYIFEQQKKLFRQKLEQREKEHNLKMKVLQQQLKSEGETHKLEIEIAKLRRDLLSQKKDINDLDFI